MNRVQLNLQALPRQLCVQISSKSLFLHRTRTKLTDTATLVCEGETQSHWIGIFRASGANRSFLRFVMGQIFQIVR